jgi:hypothetical protein
VTDAKQRKSAQAIEGVFRVCFVIPYRPSESTLGAFELIYESETAFGVDPLHEAEVVRGQQASEG